MRPHTPSAYGGAGWQPCARSLHEEFDTLWGWCGITTETVLREMDVDVFQVDLPFGTMHLMGMLRIVDRGLAIGWPIRLAHRAVDALRERGYHIAWLPDENEARKGAPFNFVTLGPCEILMAAGNPITQSFYKEHGITCHTVAVDELAKAAGAIGCLTG